MDCGIRTRRKILPKMRQSCREVRNRVVDAIDHRTHIGPGLLLVLFPIRQRLVHVKNRFIPPKADLIEERDYQPEQPLQCFLMIAPHCDNTVRLIEQRLREPPLHVAGRISATILEPGAHERMDRLGSGLDPGGADEIPALRTKMLLERILRRQAPKNVACADKKNRSR